MASLANQKPKNTYEGLLKTTDDGQVGASKKAITDGGQGATGLGLSSTKVFANTLQVENAPASSINQSVATLNASGDIESRTANSKVFDSTNSDVIFAKNNGTSASPIPYASSGDNTADSYVVGSIFTLNSADVVVAGAEGDKVEITFKGFVQFEEADAYATFALIQNGNTLIEVNAGNTSGVLSSSECIDIHYVTALTAAENIFAVTYSAGSGTTNILSASYLKVQKFS